MNKAGRWLALFVVAWAWVVSFDPSYPIDGPFALVMAAPLALIAALTTVLFTRKHEDVTLLSAPTFAMLLALSAFGIGSAAAEPGKITFWPILGFCIAGLGFWKLRIKTA